MDSSGVGSGKVNDGIDASMENADGDPATSTLDSMGYIDDEAEMDREDGDSDDSWRSVLQSIVVMAVAVLFGISFLYFLITGILALFGLQL